VIRDYVAIVAGISVVATLVGLSGPLISLLLEARGHDSTTIGWNGAMPAIAGLIGAALMPAAMRTVSAGRLMFGGLAVTALGLLPMALTDSLPVWFGLRFLLGLGLTVVFIVTEAWLSQIAPEAQRGRLIGLYSTTLALGFALGPGLLGLTGVHGAAPFIAAAVILLLPILPFAWVRDRAPSFHGEETHGVFALIGRAPDLMLAVAAFGAVESIAFTLLPIYGLAHGLGEVAAATLLTASGLGNALIQLPLGWLADHVDRRRLLVGAGLIATLAALLAPLVIADSVLRWPLMFAWGGAAVALYTVGLILLGQRFKGAELASANAAFILMYNLGFLIGPPLAGYAMQLWPPHGFIAAIAGLTLLHALVTVALKPRPA